MEDIRVIKPTAIKPSPNLSAPALAAAKPTSTLPSTAKDPRKNLLNKTAL